MSQVVFKMSKPEMTKEEKNRESGKAIAAMFNELIADNRSRYIKAFRQNALNYRRKLITAKQFDERDKYLREKYDEMCENFSLKLVDWEEE